MVDFFLIIILFVEIEAVFVQTVYGRSDQMLRFAGSDIGQYCLR